jgi:dihydrofolate reductase
VVSGSGRVDTSWQGSFLLRDIAAVRRLRDGDGPNLVTQGSTELVYALLASDLVEALTFFTIPVVLGRREEAVYRRLGAARVQPDQIACLEHGCHDRTSTLPANARSPAKSG